MRKIPKMRKIYQWFSIVIACVFFVMAIIDAIVYGDWILIPEAAVVGLFLVAISRLLLKIVYRGR